MIENEPGSMNAETQTTRIAVVQMDPQIGKPLANANAIVAQMQMAASQGARLVIFPECALSGYVFDSAEDAQPAALPVRSAITASLVTACRRYNVYAVVGLLERDDETSALYNSAHVLGPEGLIATYRKCHLPVLGIDRFVSAGDCLRVINLPFACIGLLICYDVRFPEAARALTLEGADILVVPTNWPEGAESAPEFLTRARAWENRVFVAACNRVGTERSVRFIGRSQIIAPDGRFLAQAEGDSEAILYADIDVRQARQKKLVITPGVFELDPVGGRRPDLYEALLSPL